jgi:hypothetical protein
VVIDIESIFLCKKYQTGKDPFRRSYEQFSDISSTGLKTVIDKLPLATQTLAASVCVL